MALQGTLEDFGIAEILQLIGQQAKSGVLRLEANDEVVHVLMADGCIVSAEQADRRQRDRLGSLLVRAGLLARADLDRALDAQRRTLRRLGDLLVELELVSKEDLRGMTALQTTETVYRLFAWKRGTYAFEPGAVEWDRETVTPLRAESVLMEGFRRVDEWPIVRRKISSPAMTFRRPADVPEEEVLGDSERRVLPLAAAGGTVETIVDRSRLGEFEACKALLNLVNQGVLEPVPPSRSAAAVGAYARSWRERLGRGAAALAATCAIAAAVAGLAWLASERAGAAEDGARALDDRAAQRFLARGEVARLTRALEVYRLERGHYPERLEALVEAGLATPADLRYPWSEPYHYRRDREGGFVLLPPLP